MTPQELRISILQSALQGKLTEKKAFERVDLSYIVSQKNSKMEVSEFEIPDNWCFSTLESFCEIIPTKQYQILEKQVMPFGKYPVISQSKEYQIGFTNNQERLYKIDTPIIAFGDHTAVVKHIDFDFVVGADGLKLFKPNTSVCSKYLFFALQLLTYGLGKIGGYSRHYKFIKNKPIPIPPPAEQNRIVAKIEELLPCIDRYEQAWGRLEEFNRRFPSDMQKSLLHMAIQGKLVEQRPEEGTAEELYQQIQVEKQRLIKEGKIKKEKPLPKIAEDEVPFEIPGSWKWIRTGNSGSWCAGATPSRTRAEYYDGRIPWLKTGDLNDGIVTDIPECISELALEKTSVRLNPVGTVLMAMYGATIGKLGILGIEATTNQACCACIPFEGVYSHYLFYFLLAYRSTFIKMGEGGAQPNISKEKIVNTVMPLPPLAEQRRIVAKLEELLPLCERLLLNGVHGQAGQLPVVQGNDGSVPARSAPAESNLTLR